MMGRRIGVRVRIGLALAVVAGLPWVGPAARGQQLPADPEPGGATVVVGRGQWAGVIYANDKWLVLQNQAGQQFPVALDSIRLFLMRWPLAASQIPTDALIEANGIDLGNNVVQTDHVDVYSGAARNLVSPAYVTQAAMGGMANTSPTAGQFNLQFNLFQPLYGFGTGPSVTGAALAGVGGFGQAHVVGPAVGLDPLQLGILGNAAVAIMPAPRGLYISQVTPGTPSYIRPGDVVYYVASAANAKSLALNELVVYKEMALNQFVR